MANFAEAPPASEAGVHPQPTEAVAEAVGHYRTVQPRGLGMVTNAGSQLPANGDRSHHGSPSKERQTACRISRIQAFHSGAGQVSSA